MPKVNRHGQAKILTDADYTRLFKFIENPRHRVCLKIAKFTGERWGAIARLQVSDVYLDPQERKPHDYITFRAATRKASPTGHRETRQVHVHSELRKELQLYQPPLKGWLFPSPRDEIKPCCWQSYDQWFREALARAGMDAQGYSTHSTRRTFITRLSEAGIAISVIQKLTGHRDLKALQRYIDVSPQQCERAIEAIFL